MAFWRRRTGIEDQLRAAKAEPSREATEGILRQISAGRRPRRSRLATAVVVAIAATGGVLALGGVGYATDAVKNVVDPAPVVTTSADCSVEFPCTFTINATPTTQDIRSTGDATGEMKVHVPGKAPQPISLSYNVVDCSNNPVSTVTVTFDDNPIPTDATDTGYHVSSAGTPKGGYIITITGTSGTEQSTTSIDLSVNKGKTC